jgi:hypothetical protein
VTVPQLVTSVQGLVTAGNLRPCYGTLLTQILNSAQLRISQGRPASAIVLLRSFINYVNNFINTGALSLADGTALINQANAIIASLGP